MKHLKDLDNFRKNRTVTKTNESVIIDNDGNFKVNAIIDIPQSFINSYVKKVKDEQGKNIRQLYSDSVLAEELVKWACSKYLDVTTLPSTAIIGGSQVQGQPAQAQAQSAPQGQAQSQPAQEVQPQSQVQAQGQNDSGVSVQTQTQGQAQSQPAQVQSQFIDVENEDEDEEAQAQSQVQSQDEDELPL